MLFCALDPNIRSGRSYGKGKGHGKVHHRPRTKKKGTGCKRGSKLDCCCDNELVDDTIFLQALATFLFYLIADRIQGLTGGKKRKRRRRDLSSFVLDALFSGSPYRGIYSSYPKESTRWWLRIGCLSE